MAREFTGNLVVIDGAKLAELLRGPNGPVVRALLEAGEIVKSGARRRVGVYEPPDAYAAAHRGRRPGTLRDSIVKRVTVGGPTGVAVEVGSDDDSALLHHEGTVPHVIRPRQVPLTKAGTPRKRIRPGDVKPYLAFYWPAVGHVVRTRQVRHPGTRPNRYLTDSLADLRGRI